MFDINIFNQTRFSTLEEFITTAVGSYFVILVIILAVVYSAWAGLGFIISRGDEEKAKKAQKSIAFVIIGVVICLLAPLIIQYILKNFL